MTTCGKPPKLVAVCIAPLGLVSIGVAVTGLNAMGVWSFSPGSGHWHPSSSAVQEQLLTYTSKQMALEKARALGCEGVHAMGNRWMPCSGHPAPQHSK
jgi:hypothetical protein